MTNLLWADGYKLIAMGYGLWAGGYGLAAMGYLWDEFNIKTFPAQTIVFRDGVYQPDLSTLPNNLNFDKKHDLPVHIIFIGEIAGKNDIFIEISAENMQVFFSAKITNKKPAFLNIFIKNTGKNSEFSGKILAHNHSRLEINEKAGHFAKNTGIFMHTRLIAGPDSDSRLSAIAEIAKNCENCKSDIGFSALAAQNAKIIFQPAQQIASAPDDATHSAGVWRATDAQIEYLRGGGLCETEIKEILQESFTNDFL
ncbi:MAG: SufD family Fe-S cluster assembly protein [Rickettsiales bacterium]|jgi:hypothetical protein|nr:SufD family Fe-S cluster assembly protein [Rickettsiales bacterium]